MTIWNLNISKRLKGLSGEHALAFKSSQAIVENAGRVKELGFDLIEFNLKPGLSGDAAVQTALRLLDESISNHGFAQVRLHPADFAQGDRLRGKAINELDEIQFQKLTKIMDSIVERNIRFASFWIYTHLASAEPTL